jgi:hypothetical protein
MNFGRFFKISILSFFILCFQFFPVFSVFAQGAIRISPVRIEETVDPGEIIRQSIKVTNISGGRTTLYPYLKDFKAGGETGNPELVEAGSEVYGLGAWIEISDIKEGMDFEPGEEKEISFTIRVPAETGPGGYYGAVIFGSVPPQARLRGEGEERGAAIVVGQQTGCLVLLRISGEVNEDAMIREFSTDKDFYNAPFKIDFITRIYNLGNVHIRPQGTIEVKNMLGKKVKDIIINDANSNILPESIRRFDNSWEGELGFGRYTAQLVLSFGTSVPEGGQGKQTIHDQTSFWIVPWKIIIPSILGLIFTFSLFFLFLKMYKNKAVERMMREAGLRKVRYIRKSEGPSPLLHLVLMILLILIAVLLIGILIYFLFFA